MAAERRSPREIQLSGEEAEKALREQLALIDRVGEGDQHALASLLEELGVQVVATRLPLAPGTAPPGNRDVDKLEVHSRTILGWPGMVTHCVIELHHPHDATTPVELVFGQEAALASSAFNDAITALGRVLAERQ